FYQYYDIRNNSKYLASLPDAKTHQNENCGRDFLNQACVLEILLLQIFLRAFSSCQTFLNIREVPEAVFLLLLFLNTVFRSFSLEFIQIHIYHIVQTQIKAFGNQGVPYGNF